MEFLLLGFLVGWCIGLVALVCFDDEIFGALDWMRDCVRRALRLET